MRIRKEDAVALIVDYQEKLMPVMAEGEELEKRAEIMIKGLKVLGIPIIVTQQYTKGLGMTVPVLQKAAGTEHFSEKITFSCMDDELIKKQVEDYGKKYVIVCGIEAHICVIQTCIDLKEHGYEPVLVMDCISSRKLSDKEGAILRAQQEGILMTTSEAVLFELTRKAGSPVFKTISGLIK